MYRRFYKQDQKEIERRKLAIRTRYALRRKAAEGLVSMAGATLGAVAGEAELAVTSDSNLDETDLKSLRVSSLDLDINNSNKELADEVCNLHHYYNFII